jgi:hypothetical protein
MKHEKCGNDMICVAKVTKYYCKGCQTLLTVTEEYIPQEKQKKTKTTIKEE